MAEQAKEKESHLRLPIAKDMKGNLIVKDAPCGDDQVKARVSKGVDSKGNKKKDVMKAGKAD